MTIEIEHQKEASEEVRKRLELDMRKEFLKRRLGLSDDKFDELFNTSKDFFRLHKDDNLQEGSA